MRSDFHSGGTTDCALGDGDGAVRTGVSSWGGGPGRGVAAESAGEGARTRPLGGQHCPHKEARQPAGPCARLAGFYTSRNMFGYMNI